MILPSPQVTFGAGRLTIEQVVALAERRARPALNADPAFMARVQRGADFLDRLLAEEGHLQGDHGLRRLRDPGRAPTLVAELPCT